LRSRPSYSTRNAAPVDLVAARRAGLEIRASLRKPAPRRPSASRQRTSNRDRPAFQSFAAIAHAQKATIGKTPLASAVDRIAVVHAAWSVPALWAFVACYAMLGGLTWACYLRGHALTRKAPQTTGKIAPADNTRATR
jgi:hypothetical protein